MLRNVDARAKQCQWKVMLMNPKEHKVTQIKERTFGKKGPGKKPHGKVFIRSAVATSAAKNIRQWK